MRIRFVDEAVDELRADAPSQAARSAASSKAP